MEKVKRDRARSKLQQMTNKQLDKLAAKYDVCLVRENGKTFPRKRREELCVECDALVEELGS